MPKNGQNDLKFGHNMYYDHFYPFLKIWSKFVEKW